MVAGALLGLGSDTDLERQLGPHVLQRFAAVELLSFSLEVVLDHVDVGFVVLMVDAGVAHYADSELMEALCHFATFFLPSAFLLVEEALEVDDWHFLKV